MNFLQSNYTVIEHKIKNGEYSNLFEIEDELKEFAKYYEENGPPGPSRKAILHEFCQKAFSEAAEFFIKGLTNELNLQKSFAKEASEKLHQQVKEIKEESKGKLEQYESKLRNAETEKAEISAKEQTLRETLHQVTKEKEQIEEEMRQRLDAEKKDGMRQIEEFKNKLYHQEESAKETNRQVMAAQSEFEKQKALLDQKIEFLERAQEEWQKKEKEYSAELKNLKRDHLSNIKDSTSKYDQ